MLAGRNVRMQGDVWFQGWQVADRRANGIGGCLMRGRSTADLETNGSRCDK